MGSGEATLRTATGGAHAWMTSTPSRVPTTVVRRSDVAFQLGTERRSTAPQRSPNWGTSTGYDSRPRGARA